MIIYVFVIDIVFIIIINERRTFMEILFISTIAGLLQGLTGFGAGIILMLYLPYLYPVIQCSGIIWDHLFVFIFDNGFTI